MDLDGRKKTQSDMGILWQSVAEAVSYPAAFSRTMSYLFQESDYPFVDMPFDGILGAPGMLRLRFYWARWPCWLLQGHVSPSSTGAKAAKASTHVESASSAAANCCRHSFKTGRTKFLKGQPL